MQKERSSNQSTPVCKKWLVLSHESIPGCKCVSNEKYDYAKKHRTTSMPKFCIVLCWVAFNWDSCIVVELLLIWEGYVIGPPVPCVVNVVWEGFTWLLESSYDENPVLSSEVVCLMALSVVFQQYFWRNCLITSLSLTKKEILPVSPLFQF